MTYFVKKHRETITFLIVFFLATLFLVNLFPYSGDDWAWGSNIGIERLENGFYNYNGRYAGNLLVLLLTRSNIARVIFISLSILAIVILPTFLFNKKNALMLILSGVLLFIIPKPIFVQSFVWTAGFSNYVPPILMAVTYFAIIQNILQSSAPSYKPYITLITFFLGFAGSLFMENITLYFVVLSIAVLLFSFFKYHKIYAAHGGFFLGSVLGSLLMFSNSAYHSIASGNDNYRSVANNDTIATIINHAQQISYYLFYDNILLLIVLSLCVLILSLKYLNEHQHSNPSVLGLIFVHCFTLLIICFKALHPEWVILEAMGSSPVYSKITYIFVALVYSLTVYMLSLFTIKDSELIRKLFFCFFSIVVIVIPLLIVNPIGPRCFFPPFLLMVFYTLGLLSFLIRPINPSTVKALYIFSLSALTSLFIFWSSIYSTIHQANIERNESVQEQLSNTESIIEIVELPYKSFVWMGDPVGDLWVQRYKLFWNIPADTELILLPRD